MLWKFDYEFDKVRLLKEAMSNKYNSLPTKYERDNIERAYSWTTDDNNYAPFTDVGNCSNEKFVEWLEKNKESSPKVAKFYDELRVHVKNANKSCPYALEIAKYFANLVGEDNCPRFYYQKKGFKLRLHTDRGTRCSINFVLTEDPDPIYFENDKQTYYKVGLLNTSELHGVIATEDRYLFKISFPDISFEKVKDVLSSKLSN
jgi:hypothetical protein